MYAKRFLIDDIKNWSHLYPGRAYEPDDDYWYILLRSAARCSASESAKLSLLSMCLGATSRGIKEAVLESLADVGTSQDAAMINVLASDPDPFISDLAEELLD